MPIPYTYHACPHLGMVGDTATHCSYATRAHLCYRPQRPAPITVEHQRAHCLSNSYAACPVYTGEVVQPPGSGGQGRRGVIALAAIATSAVAVLIAAIAVTRSGAGDASPEAPPGGAAVSTSATAAFLPITPAPWSATPTGVPSTPVLAGPPPFDSPPPATDSIAEAPPPEGAAPAAAMAVAVAEPTPVPVTAALPPPTPTPTRPPGPIRHLVRPGDTLIGIASFYGVRPQDIISLNGLPADGFIMAGQEILVPR